MAAAPPAAMMADAAAEAVNVVPSSIDAAAVGRELGELFEYRIAQPVTIRKNESAMLPFLQQTDRRAQAADLFRPQLAASHQCRRTDQLQRQDARRRADHGLRRGAYAGEALMETLKASDKRLISYAVDLGTRITEAFGSKQDWCARSTPAAAS